MLKIIQMNDSLLFLLFGRHSLIAEKLYPKISKMYEKVKSFHLCKKRFYSTKSKSTIAKAISKSSLIGFLNGKRDNLFKQYLRLFYFI